jgi:predicted  nucleic acid-binding Zn-ribbon protein
VADTIATLHKELGNEQQAREEAKKDAETLTREVKDLKKIVDQLSTHVPALEAQVKTMSGTIVDVNIEL